MSTTETSPGMATRDVAPIALGPGPDAAISVGLPGPDRLSRLRRGALITYGIAFLLGCGTWGIPLARELVIAWVCGALACASIGRTRSQILLILWDWLPIVAIFTVYDFSRGAADTLGMPVHTDVMIDFDRFLFGGTTPTEWLQDHIYDAAQVHWWDALFTIVYTSHFFAVFVVAGVLWSRNREDFKKFTRRLLTLTGAGLSTYILFPATPPWLAAEEGHLGNVVRSSSRGWELVSIHSANSIQKGQGTVNLVAAMPSLHCGFATLISVYLWPRVKIWWRPLLFIYPIAMGFSLMATGEHYFMDVALGWIYAGVVVAGWNWWERRKAQESPPTAVAVGAGA